MWAPSIGEFRGALPLFVVQPLGDKRAVLGGTRISGACGELEPFIGGHSILKPRFRGEHQAGLVLRSRHPLLGRLKQPTTRYCRVDNDTLSGSIHTAEQ